jgi:hypothetical protein
MALADLNGDGQNDLIIGSYNQGSSSSGNGAAYVFDSAGSGTVDLSTYDRRWTGSAASSGFGGTVASAGDIDGDGYEDVVVGGYRYSTYRGYAAIFMGDAVLPTSGTTTVTGSATGDYCGVGLGGGMDVTGDGNDDYAVGCYGLGNGAVYVKYATGTYTLSGSAGDGFGTQVIFADWNGDGDGDVFVQAYDSDRMYAFNGPITGSETSAGADDDGYAHYYGASNIGDMDGDGYDEIAFSYDDNDVVIVAGGATPSLGTYLTSISGFDQVGDVSGGDINGDGKADVLVGDYFDDTGTVNAGAGLIGYAPLARYASTTDLEVLYSPTAGNYVGEAVLAGDHDGDGVSDVFVGSYEDDSGGGNAGAVFAWYGLGL